MNSAFTITVMFSVLLVFIASVVTIICTYYANPDNQNNSYAITAYVLQGIILAILLSFMIAWMVQK